MTTISYERIEKELKEYSRNSEWANKNVKSLQRYVGKYVAISGEKIIGSSYNAEELKDKYNNIPGVFIEYVVKKGLLWIL